MRFRTLRYCLNISGTVTFIFCRTQAHIPDKSTSAEWYRRHFASLAMLKPARSVTTNLHVSLEVTLFKESLHVSKAS